MIRRGRRRTLALAAALLFASASARADTAVKIASVPAYVFAAGALLLGCSAANTGEEPVYSQDGFYGGFGGTYAFEDFTIGPLQSDDSWGLNGSLGYRCHPRVAVEANLEWLEGFKLQNANVDDLSGVTATANVKFYLLTERIQPFLLAGVGATYLSHRPTGGTTFGSSEEDVTIRMGGGIDVYATERLAVTAGSTYVLPTDKLEDLAYVSLTLGLQYRF